MATDNLLTYAGVTVTAPITTAANLLALIQAVAGYAGVGPVAREVTIQADMAAAGTIYVGDSRVTTANYAYALTAGQSKTYPNGVELGRLYVITDVASSVHVEVNTGTTAY